MPKPHIECVVDTKARLGEVTYWDHRGQRLWWLDIHGKTIHQYEPKTGLSFTFDVLDTPGCLVVREVGRLIVAMKNGFYFCDCNSVHFAPVIEAEVGIPLTRMNDGETDRQGRF
jgi:sugar lactone lactonase YvrE